MTVSTEPGKKKPDCVFLFKLWRAQRPQGGNLSYQPVFIEFLPLDSLAKLKAKHNRHAHCRCVDDKTVPLCGVCSAHKEQQELGVNQPGGCGVWLSRQRRFRLCFFFWWLYFYQAHCIIMFWRGRNWVMLLRLYVCIKGVLRRVRWYARHSASNGSMRAELHEEIKRRETKSWKWEERSSSPQEVGVLNTENWESEIFLTSNWRHASLSSVLQNV